MSEEYKIRALTSAEEVRNHHVRFAISEVWTPVDYSEIYYPQDPHGFFIGELDGVGPIATVSAVKYGEFYSFIGYYIVEKKYRGRGYGKKLFDHALEYAKGKGPYVVGLDALLVQVGNYQKSGFEVAFTNAKYSFNSKKASEQIKSLEKTTYKIVSAKEGNFEDLKAYDLRHFGAPRQPILEHLVHKQVSFVAIENGVIVGVGAANRLAEGTGTQIGPLFANNTEIAEQLLLALSHATQHPANGLPEMFYFLGTHANPGSIELTKKFGMEIVFECVRMYNASEGTKLELPLQNIFSFSSFEFS